MPTSPPSSPQTSEPPSGEAAPSFDFSGLTDEGAEAAAPVIQATVGEGANAPTPAPSAPAAPVVATTTQAPSGVQPAAVVVPLPTPSPAPAPQPAAAAALDMSTPEGVMGALQRDQDSLIQAWADKYFALTEDQANELVTNPVKALPLAAARILYHAISATVGQVHTLVPPMFQALNRATTERGQRVVETEAKFYAKWPQVPRGKHDTLILTYAKAYRSAHPNAPVDEVLDRVGRMVLAELNLPTTAQAPTNSPFVPAGNGARSIVPQPVGEASPWDGFQSEDGF